MSASSIGGSAAWPRRGRLRRTASRPRPRASFALVSEDGGTAEAGIELVLASGPRLRIAQGVDEATLRAVLAALEAGEC